MKRSWHSLNEKEKGSVTIEFLGLLPFILILLILFIQIIGSGYSILLGQKAIHESAKVYSITGDEAQATDTIQSIVGSSTILSFDDIEITDEEDGYFTVEMTGIHGIVVGPQSWRGIFELPHKAYSRMIK